MKSIIIKNNKFKSVFVSLNLLVPLKAEEMSKNALLAMVLTKACNKYKTEKELQRELAKLYNTKLRISVGKYNGKYNIGFEMEIINKKYIEKDVLEDSLKILNQIINQPLQINGNFDEKITQREKENLITKIKEQQDQKRSYALGKIEEITFEKQDYGYPKLGKEKDVEEIDHNILYKHYLKVMEQAEIITIVNGNLDGYENIKEIIEKHLFKDKPQITVKKNVEEIIEYSKNPVVKIENQDISQSILCFGIRLYNLTEKEIFNTSVLNSVLGGSPASKLFQNIREKQSLAYYAKSIYDKQKGAIYIIAGIEPKNYEKTKELINLEIQKIIAGDITEEEITSAKDHIISTYKEIEDNKKENCRFILSNQILFSKVIKIEDIINNIKSLEKKDIINIAKKINVQKIFLLGGKLDD